MYFRLYAIIALLEIGTSLASSFRTDKRQHGIAAAKSISNRPKHNKNVLPMIPSSFISVSMLEEERISSRFKQRQQQQQQKLIDQPLISKNIWEEPKKIRYTKVCMSDANNENDKGVKESSITNEEERKPKKEIAVSATIDLPFSASVAYDAFSDLSRQPSWSPMIRSVEYLDETYNGNELIVATTNGVTTTDGNDGISSSSPVTEWTMGASGLKFSWKAVSTTLKRPNCIAWESISGLKNMGKVDFVEINEESSKMTLSMTFLTPRIVSAMFRRSNKLASYVERAFIMETLVRFRDVVMLEEEEEGLGNTLLMTRSIE
uniref:Coenzyme Q-binding protein COQ10 START domain-containing protein n=1 Tax=Helicotheca tamesis TaxID=374047 RepID=A0A7S2HDW2_9STRA|mmetsp:Transcript_17278/g.23795  ORF Transcript_17278/g.23795 Transcript_17278/m.23795 type:complete len:319 (+) Transcript_17278:74-1030(+)